MTVMETLATLLGGLTALGAVLKWGAGQARGASVRVINELMRHTEAFEAMGKDISEVKENTDACYRALARIDRRLTDQHVMIQAMKNGMKK